MKMNLFKRRVSIVLTAATVCMGSLLIPQTPKVMAADAAQQSSQTESSENTAVTEAASSMIPSVVAIIGKPAASYGRWEANRFDLAHGTGVIVSSDGNIVTNAHVVKDMKNIVVVTSDGRQYTGRTTHLDEESDLALVKIEATGLKAAVFAEKDSVKVGQQVAAIGTPISFTLRNSVTAGVVSGIERSVNSAYKLIQTDAAINPGNSGGALINMKGEIVGINSLKFVEYGVDSLGFAIPSDTVQYVLKHFNDYGKVKRPYLGVEIEESWEAIVGLPTQEALRASYVDPESPAGKAGVKQGDVLLALDDYTITTLADFNEMLLKNYLPGQQIKLKVKNGKGITNILDITLDENNSGPVWKPIEDDKNIDQDKGKTKIGDSHYGWSMKYPAELIQGYQSDNGDTVSFSDAKGEFTISIHVEDHVSTDLSKQGLLRKLGQSDRDDYSYTRYSGSNLVLEKRYVDKADHPYALKISKSNYGSYNETRAYLVGDKIYYVSLIIHSEDNYKNKSKYNRYRELVDTFTFAFNKKDASLKDISVRLDGYRTYTNEYGLSIGIPADWAKQEGRTSLTYYNEDMTQIVAVDVTSLSEGDTLNAWAKRDEEQFKANYVESFRKTSGIKPIKLDGMDALENRLSLTMGKDWHTSHFLYFIKGAYKYSIAIIFDPEEKDDAEKLIENIRKSVTVNKEDINPSLGFIQDESELLDPSKTITVKNNKYKYTLSVPEIWSSFEHSFSYMYGSKDDPSYVMYDFTGGYMSVTADNKMTLDELKKKKKAEYKKNKDNDAEYKVNEEEVKLFGVTAYKASITYKTKSAPYTATDYMFSKNGVTYLISMQINDAVNTQANADRLKKAFQSFKLIE